MFLDGFLVGKGDLCLEEFADIGVYAAKECARTFDGSRLMI
jgi:hypothetical protein